MLTRTLQAVKKWEGEANCVPFSLAQRARSECARWTRAVKGITARLFVEGYREKVKKSQSGGLTNF